jgi:hypothetical protein
VLWSPPLCSIRLYSLSASSRIDSNSQATVPSQGPHHVLVSRLLPPPQQRKKQGMRDIAARFPAPPPSPPSSVLLAAQHRLPHRLCATYPEPAVASFVAVWLSASYGPAMPMPAHSVHPYRRRAPPMLHLAGLSPLSPPPLRAWRLVGGAPALRLHRTALRFHLFAPYSRRNGDSASRRCRVLYIQPQSKSMHWCALMQIAYALCILP